MYFNLVEIVTTSLGSCLHPSLQWMKKTVAKTESLWKSCNSILPTLTKPFLSKRWKGMDKSMRDTGVSFLKCSKIGHNDTVPGTERTDWGGEKVISEFSCFSRNQYSYCTWYRCACDFAGQQSGCDRCGTRGHQECGEELNPWWDCNSLGKNICVPALTRDENLLRCVLWDTFCKRFVDVFLFHEN